MRWWLARWLKLSAKKGATNTRACRWKITQLVFDSVYSCRSEGKPDENRQKILKVFGGRNIRVTIFFFSAVVTGGSDLRNRAMPIGLSGMDTKRHFEQRESLLTSKQGNGMNRLRPDWIQDRTPGLTGNRSISPQNTFLIPPRYQD